MEISLGNLFVDIGASRGCPPNTSFPVHVLSVRGLNPGVIS